LDAGCSELGFKV